MPLKVPPNRIVRQPLKTIPSTLLKGVGRVLVAHARLELRVTELVFELLRVNPKLGRHVLRGENPTRNFETAQRLLRVWGITEPKGLEGKIKRAYGRRNAVAHGFWVKGIKAREVRLALGAGYQQTSVGAIHRRTLPQFATFSFSQLVTDANFINSVADEVKQLQNDARKILERWKIIVPTKVPRKRAKGT